MDRRVQYLFCATLIMLPDVCPCNALPHIPALAGTLVHEAESDSESCSDDEGDIAKKNQSKGNASLDMLMVTQGYCCFSLRSARTTRDRAVPWYEVEEISVLEKVLNLNEIVFELQDGEKFTFYPSSRAPTDLRPWLFDVKRLPLCAWILSSFSPNLLQNT